MTIKIQVKSLILFALILVHGSSNAQIMWQIKKDTVITWHYSEGDEFNGNEINTSYWKYAGWARSIYTNKEQQYYSSGKNHIVKDGHLTLFAKRETVNEKVIDWKADNDSINTEGRFYGINKRNFSWTAGQIETSEHFVYGYYEAKFKMPSKKGFWPAFWLAGGDPNEEIDMMELKTEKRNQIHVGRHSTKRKENYVRTGLTKKAWGDWVKFKGDLTSGYNIVAVEWTPESVTYFLNGEIIAYTKLNLPHVKRIIFNIAVPSNNGPFKPGPADTVKHSGDFEIDYVRVWKTDSEFSSRKHLFVKKSGMPDSLSATRLQSKKKFIYGKKKLHANEGLTVSLSESQNNVCILTVLGKEIPADAKFSLKAKDGSLLKSDTLHYGETVIDLLDTGNMATLIEIEVFGRKAFGQFYNTN
ncbi:MAG: glycoside hydrolase family 16 protein [Bacteroidia bacterium]|nr:glycoside hydrolase family 16 protein [Bacteroidia bacterium]